MRLSELFENVPDIEIKNLMADSRTRRPDSIFFCLKGLESDGHRFVAQAIENGAKAVVYSEPISTSDPDVVYIQVEDVTHVFNQVADAFYNHPSHRMKMYGVTGTNGKSSIACIIRDILNEVKPTGYIGTISIAYGNVKLPPLLTTPNIDDLHGILNDMVDAGMQACAMEASSIGIEQGRVDAIDFDVAIFTNLTHDHLDYHGTMEKYFLAKKKLFDNMKKEGVAITNADDPYGRRIVSDCPCRIITYGIDTKADYQVIKYQLLKDKTKLTLSVKGTVYNLETNLVARFNIYNLLASIAALHETGIAIEDMQQQINRLSQIQGRMERIEEGQPFNVLVDFAHTPDGILQVCDFAGKITPKENRIIALTGSAGKRDVEKRVQFGEILDKYADMIILTEDDPRDEDPLVIAHEIAEGIKETNYVIIENRPDAIRQAIELADPNDTIILLGKGDEKFIYRDFGREEYLGDDTIARQVIRKYWLDEGGIENG